MILGIDQSMACSGLVILDDEKMIHHEVFKTSKDDGSIFVRFNMISNKLIDMILKYNIDKVNIEGLPFGRIPGNASRDLAALQGVIISKILEQCNIECKIIPPTAVKKFATESGKAKKEDMVKALPEDIRQRFIDSNLKKSTGLYDATDAYFIGLYQ